MLPLADQGAALSAGAPEARVAPRVSLLLRAAKLVSPSGEFLCILRDVSASGFKARLFHRLPTERPLKLELGNGQAFMVEPVWERDSHAGFRFLHQGIDVSELVRESTPFPRRSLRLKLTREIRVIDGDRTWLALLRDISLMGVSLELDRPLPLRKQVVLDHGEIPLGEARVRWRRGSVYGLILQRSLNLEQLARLLAHVNLGDENTPCPLVDA